MRRLVLALVLLTSLFSCQSINDSDKRNANWIWWVDAKTGKGIWTPVGHGKNAPKIGSYTSFYFNGNVAEKGQLINGLDVDTTFFYDINGGRQGYLLYKTTAIDNQTQDTINYFFNNGPIKMFRTDGTICAIGVVENHSFGDKWTYYFENGKPSHVKNSNRDTGWITNYYKNGKVKDSDYAEGKHLYPIKLFYPQGQIEKSCEFKNHGYNGLLKKYYLNGRLKGVCNVINGKLNGRQLTWFEDGHLEEIQYVKNGLRNGPDTVYYESGKIDIIASSIDGQLTEYKEFNEKGKLITHNIVKDGIIIENKLAEQTPNKK